MREGHDRNSHEIKKDCDEKYKELINKYFFSLDCYPSLRIENCSVGHTWRNNLMAVAALAKHINPSIIRVLNAGGVEGDGKSGDSRADHLKKIWAAVGHGYNLFTEAKDADDAAVAAARTLLVILVQGLSRLACLQFYVLCCVAFRCYLCWVFV